MDDPGIVLTWSIVRSAPSSRARVAATRSADSEVGEKSTGQQSFFQFSSMTPPVVRACGHFRTPKDREPHRVRAALSSGR